MPTQCPKCQSVNIETKDYARKAGGTLGCLGGAASGVASALSGAEIGALVGTTVGIVAGPIGSRLGRLAGAILGGLVGGSAGGLTGAKLGHVIDERVLDNYHCLACDYSFSLRTSDDTLSFATTAND